MATRHRIARAAGATLALLTITAVTAAPADAHLTLGIQDQGADTSRLEEVADTVAATTIRFVVRADGTSIGGGSRLDAQAVDRRIRAARAAGRGVQVAVLVKGDTTAGDFRWLLRRWDGMVNTVSIGNEPELNGVSACRYASLYGRVYSLIRREFPNVRSVGIGESNPSGAVEYMRRVVACAARSHRRLFADFYAIHPYQFASDPLAVSADQAPGGEEYWGIGKLSRVHRWLAARSTRRTLSTRGRRALPIRVTEFSYLVSGRYAVTPEKAAWMWPRAIRQAAKWAEQLVVYGVGPVPAASNWGSAALLDAAGRPTAALEAIARR